MSNLASRAEAFVESQPVNPVDLEMQIIHANELLEELVQSMGVANEWKYECEINYSRRKNSRITYWLDNGQTATFARAQAEVESSTQYAAYLNAKATHKHLEEVAKALQTKIYSWLNINKSLAAQFQTYR